MSDPYVRAGLERNPFVAEATPGVDPEAWIDRGLPDPPEWRAGHLLQLIGPKGAGKTSHILRWSKGAPGPYVHVGPGWERLRPLPSGRLVYWDEADRAIGLQRALRRQRRVGGMTVVGVHRSLEPEALRAGLTVTTHRIPSLTAEDVLRFATARIEACGGELEVWRDFPFGSIAAESAGSLRRAGELLHVAVAARVADSRFEANVGRGDSRLSR